MGIRIRAESILRVPAMTRLRLTWEQYSARAHLVHLLWVDEPREQFEAVARSPLEFKAGEELEVYAMPKGWAGQVAVLEEAAEAAAPTNTQIPGTEKDGTDEASGAASAAPPPAQKPKPGKAKGQTGAV
jgi:hypothetical protein